LLSDLVTHLPAGIKADNAARLWRRHGCSVSMIQSLRKKTSFRPNDEACCAASLNSVGVVYRQTSGHHPDEKQSAKLESASAHLRNNLAQPCVYVHRDYHSRNLMVTEPNAQARFPHPNPLRRERGQTRKAIFNLAGHPRFPGRVYGPSPTTSPPCSRRLHQMGRGRDHGLIIRYWEKARKAGLAVREDFGEFLPAIHKMMGVQRISVPGYFSRACITATARTATSRHAAGDGLPARACERYISISNRCWFLLMELEIHAQQTGTQIEHALHVPSPQPSPPAGEANRERHFLMLAMILSCGSRRRMLPLTERTPKPLLQAEW